MTYLSPRIAALIALCTLGIVACDNPTSTLPIAGGSASRSVSLQADLGTEIQTLIATGYPKGRATAIGAMWDQVLRALAKEPKTTLKGKVVPGNSGRSELAKVASYIKLKTGDALPPSGETQAHFAARLVLDMSLYVYGGPTTPPPVITAASDIALGVVLPGTTDTVVTPAKLAAVVFPPGGVAEPTVVVITSDTAYYPANCSGPLDTHLCQYPRFYRFNVFPDVKLGAPAKVQVCHVDAGPNRLPLADHDRFRVAHVKPASPADYSTGSTIVDNVEVLAFAVMNVTNCPADGGTTYYSPVVANLSPLGRLQAVAMGVVNSVAHAAKSIFVPKDVYAIDIGGGGFAESFSPFAVVDPQSKQDLAQSTTSYFAPTMTSLVVGQSVPLQAWSVTNLGSGTSGAFTSQVVIATDSLLNTPVLMTALGGAPSLVPRANFYYAARSIPMPAAPGTYYVGTRILYSATDNDSTAADDWTSFKVVVNAPAPPPNGNSYSLLSQTTYNTPNAGGTGGSEYTIPCNAGSVAVGMTGVTGGFYNYWATLINVSLICAPLLENGLLGTAYQAVGQAGTDGSPFNAQNTTPFTGTCSAGRVLTGGAGTIGGSPLEVSDLSGSCATLATVISHGSSDEVIGPWHGTGVGERTPFDLPCNAGYVVTGLHGRSGWIVDAIGFQCTQLVVPVPIG
jgi:hypothetical protein